MAKTVKVDTVRDELKKLYGKAKAGQVMALLCVTVEPGTIGIPVGKVTVVASQIATAAEIEAFSEALQRIADVLTAVQKRHIARPRSSAAERGV